GWRTSDTPIAWKLRPASSGREAVAEGGRRLPRTWEKFTPPRSSKCPSSVSMLRPPPPSGRTQPSRRNEIPSSSSKVVTMRVCNPVRYSLTAPESTTLAYPSKQALFGTDGAEPDIAAHLTSSELNLICDFVGASLCDAHRVPQSGDTQHPAAIGEDLAVLHTGASVEHVDIIVGALDARDLIAFARILWITAGGHHHA